MLGARHLLRLLALNRCCYHNAIWEALALRAANVLALWLRLLAYRLPGL